MLRSSLVIFAALLTSACNLVTTEQPMFGPEAAGKPMLKDGLWLVDDDKCRVDASKPADKWPECANWMLLRNGRMEFPGKDGPGTPEEVSMLITGGQPRIWQLSVKDEKGKALTLYAGFEPVETDAEGRVVRYWSWPAQCGPVPKVEGRDPELEDLVTKHPFPGLVMDGGGCHPIDEAALRNAVAASEAFQDERDEARWIRATYP